LDDFHYDIDNSFFDAITFDIFILIAAAIADIYRRALLLLRCCH